jgi:hypothetical protein
MSNEVQIPEEGIAVVSLNDLDVTVYKNSRKTVTDEHLQELQRTLGNNRGGEQLQNISGSLQKNGKIGVWAGYCRTEAMTRNALKDLVAKWNEDNGYKPGKDGYIDPSYNGMGFDARKVRAQIYESGGKWKEAFVNALKVYPVNVVTRPVENDEEALALGWLENVAREDPPVWDNCIAVKTLADSGWSGKDIAKKTGKKEAMISQLKTIRTFPNLFLKRAEEDESFDSDKVGLIKTALNEFVRRCSLNHKTEDAALTLTHARALAIAARGKKGGYQISTLQTYRLLCKLVHMDESGSLHPEKSRIDYSVFVAAIEDAKKASRLDEDDEDKDKELDIDKELAKLEKETVNDLAELQEKQKESKVTDTTSKSKATDDSDEAEIKAANEEMVSDDDFDLDDYEAELAKLRESSNRDTDVAEDTKDSDSDMESLEDLASELDGLEELDDSDDDDESDFDEDEDEDDEVPEFTGEKRTKTISSGSTSEINVLAPIKIKKLSTTTKALIDEILKNNDPVEIAVELGAQLQSVQLLATILGDDEDEEKFNGLSIEFNEKLEEFIRFAIEAVKEHAPKEAEELLEMVPVILV